MYDSLLDNRLSHGSPFARILELGRVRRVVQVGIRTENSHQRDQRSRYGCVEAYTMRDWPPPPEALHFPADAKVYVSIDMDAMDPAFAPGVSHHEPGGLSVRDVLRTLGEIRAPGGVVGGDVVEYNPRRDVDGATAMVAAKVVKELAETICKWSPGSGAEVPRSERRRSAL
eukprot:TRINITY_DN11914_c0_g1_i2.p1 TRINITY_DN11914_c0_g1~~TRINITY_DN11914_c0_g1_i2.p1  ORF type:complete len:171 (+),score=45.81 TRINITY_DN11914_c0_g1_i2:549-1061(+)